MCRRANATILSGQLSSSLNIWGQVSNQIGGNGYNDTQVMLGVKYIF
ncbi:autotransporter outer membrane beta-barrel domain-containing protein [Salmonella enterica]|nr:autotransporter outer membrane beta-barrel domain-containing protein [Salmonella enterica]